MENQSEIVFTVPGNPVPKPRMTQGDRWAIKKQTKRAPLLERYFKYRTDVAWSYKAVAKGKVFQKCQMGFKFYVVGYPSSDLSNYIKGVEDALVGVAYLDDRAKIVGKYYDDPEVIFLCYNCDKKKNGKETCGAVESCGLAKSVIKIKEL